MDGESLEVIIPDENPEFIIEQVETNPAAFVSDSPQDGIEDLRRQLAEATDREKAAREDAVNARRLADEESRRRADSDRIARESSGAAANATAEARQREYESVVNAHTATANNIQSLKEQYIKAQTDGEFAKAAELQVNLGREAARLERLEEGKNALEEQRRIEANRPRPAPVQQETQDQFNNRSWNSSEYENIIRGCTPSTAAWMRANPRYASDPSYRRQVQGAHNILTGRGVSPDTDEYFRGVEELVGVRSVEEPHQESRQAPRENAVSNASKPTQSRTSPTVSAPPSRNVPTTENPRGDAGAGNRVRLTAAQREMARIMFSDAKDDQGRKMDPEVAYAKHWREAQREGKLKDGGIVL